MYLQSRKLNHMDKFLGPEYWLVYGSAIALWIWDFMIPVWPFVGLSFGLVLGDLYTGINAAKKRGEKISSKRLRSTVTKFADYCVAIVAAQAVREVLLPAIPSTYTIALVICIAEFKSILENVQASHGIDLWSRIKHLIGPRKLDK